MKKLQGWIFTYNSYTEKWMAAKRENYTKLFSDMSSSDVLKSSSFNTLQELIIRTGGDQTKLKRLVNEKV